jgi:hypothetical protein
VPSDAPTFRIATEGEGNQITVHVSDETAMFEVRSERGIGSASAERISGESPGRIVIRLYLRGLEKLDFTYANTVVTVSVSSHGDYAVSESVRTEGTGPEKPIGQDSPYWMKVDVVVPSGQTGPETPPPSYFEVEVPGDFMKGGYRAFSIDWIDFYR